MNKQRRLLVKSILALSVCFGVSVVVLITALQQQQDAAVVMVTPKPEQGETDPTADQVSTPPTEEPATPEAETSEVDSEATKPTAEQVEEVGPPVIGMSESDLLQARGSAQVIRPVIGASVHEYADVTYVIDDETQAIIGYWLDSNQAQQAQIPLDLTAGFAQTTPGIDWQGPYENFDRGSAYVLYGYTEVDGVAYTLEFGADDALGMTNQLLAVYQ